MPMHFALTVALLSSVVGALEKPVTPITSAAVATVPTSPASCTAKHFHALDFWLGRWTVTTAQGQSESEISLLPGGCLIREDYRTPVGYAGSSLNFIDPADQKWHQIWVDNTGTVIRYLGSQEGVEMVFVGVAVDAQGQRTHSRMRFSPKSDGSVVQIMQSGGTVDSLENVAKKVVWKTIFRGVYKKTSAPELTYD
jgi:hypothetical protein